MGSNVPFYSSGHWIKCIRLPTAIDGTLKDVDKTSGTKTQQTMCIILGMFCIYHIMVIAIAAYFNAVMSHTIGSVTRYRRAVLWRHNGPHTFCIDRQGSTNNILRIYSLRRRRLICRGVHIINFTMSPDRLRFIMGAYKPVRGRHLDEQKSSWFRFRSNSGSLRHEYMLVIYRLASIWPNRVL